MSALSHGLGVLALVGAGTVGYLGHVNRADITQELSVTQSSLEEAEKALSEATDQITELTTSFEKYSTSTGERLQSMQLDSEKIRDGLDSGLAALDDQIAQKLLKHVRKDEVSHVLEEYRNSIIKEASDNVVYVMAGSGSGSGFFINDSGRALTNCHVVQRAKKVTLMTWDENWIEADVVARDAATDIAILQVVDDDLKFLKEKKALPKGAALADSNEVETGDYVFAMGAPHRLTQTVNAGQVSNTKRFLPGLPILDSVSGVYNLYFQIDAGVMPGNSGGPSFDIHGQVIGINTRANYQNEAEGFVLPINFVMDRVKSMLASTDNRNHYNTLGFDLNPYFRRFNEIGGRPKVLPQEYEAALQVGRVFDDSPAYKKNFKTGDLILEINGEAPKLNIQGDVIDIRREFAFGEPGTEYTFKVQHMPKMSRGKVVQKGKIETITLKVLDAEEYTMPVGVNMLRAYFNALEEDSIPEGFEGGVKFISGYNSMDLRRIKKGSLSANYPFKKGDVIVEVNKEAIESLWHLNIQLQEIGKHRKIPDSIGVMRGDTKVELKPIRGRPPAQPPTTKPPGPKKPKRKTEIF